MRRQKLHRIYRLHEMEVEPCFPGALTVAVLAPACNGYHADVWADRLLPQLARDLAPFVPGMPMSRRTTSGSNCKRGARNVAIVNLSSVLLGELEQLAEAAGGIDVVVNDTNPIPNWRCANV